MSIWDCHLKTFYRVNKLEVTSIVRLTVSVLQILPSSLVKEAIYINWPESQVTSGWCFNWNCYFHEIYYD